MLRTDSVKCLSAWKYNQYMAYSGENKNNKWFVMVPLIKVRKLCLGGSWGRFRRP